MGLPIKCKSLKLYCTFTIMETNTGKIIKVGLLAYGMSGKVFHAPFFSTHAGFEFKAVVERNAKKANNDYPKVKSYNSVDELLSDAEIDLVVINTPNNLHYEQAKQALKKGKHILVEKPFTATSADAKELFDLADEANKQIFFYQNRRFNSDFLSVKEVIDSGKLGKLVEIHIRFDRYRNTIGPKAFKEKPIEASGLMYDLGPHLLDQAIYLFGKPQSFNKVLSKNRAESLVDDYFSIQLNYATVTVFLTASLLVVQPQKAFVLHGTEGTFVKDRTDVQEDQLIAGIKPNEDGFAIEKPGSEGVLTTINKEGVKTETWIESKIGNYMQIFEDVYQSLTDKKPYPVKREDVITQIEILEQ
jgi:scyllo-inositol 2-dehydrogenase (NADP+)